MVVEGDQAGAAATGEHLGHRGVHHDLGQPRPRRRPAARASAAATQDTGPPEVNTTAVCLGSSRSTVRRRAPRTRCWKAGKLSSVLVVVLPRGPAVDGRLEPDAPGRRTSRPRSRTTRRHRASVLQVVELVPAGVLDDVGVPAGRLDRAVGGLPVPDASSRGPRRSGRTPRAASAAPEHPGLLARRAGRAGRSPRRPRRPGRAGPAAARSCVGLVDQPVAALLEVAAPSAGTGRRPRWWSGRGGSGSRSAGRSRRAGTARTPRRTATAPA